MVLKLNLTEKSVGPVHLFSPSCSHILGIGLESNTLLNSIHVQGGNVNIQFEFFHPALLCAIYSMKMSL
jgi:hypothetical protein